MTKVNPDILRWARETAVLSPEEATKKLKIGDQRGEAAVDKLLALEKGDKEPPRPMIVKMAKQYRRPLLTFYMSAPPLRETGGETSEHFLLGILTSTMPLWMLYFVMLKHGREWFGQH